MQCSARPASRFDSPLAARLIPVVQRVRRLLALALLALWLPATLHCGLEAAGLDELFHCAAEHHAVAHDDTSASDACDVIEGAAFKPAANTAVLPPPVLHAVVLALFSAPPVVALPLTPPPRGLSAHVAAPPEVARTWHFLVRAAPPPRAPSLAS